MYVGEWRFKGGGEPVFRVSAPDFKQVQTLLAQELLGEDVQSYQDKVECDMLYTGDFALALSEVEFRQAPFGITINNIEVSIFEMKGNKS